MTTTKHTIFRTEAIQRYTQSREQAVLPRFIRPRTLLLMWIMILLLLISASLSWFVQIPIYIEANAIVTVDEQGEAHLLTLISETDQLTLSQSTLWLIDSMGDRQAQPIIQTSEEIYSPLALQTQYPKYATSLAQLATHPVQIVVSTYQLDAAPSTQDGRHVAVEIETGSQRLIALFPFIGTYFQG